MKYYTLFNNIGILHFCVFVPYKSASPLRGAEETLVHFGPCTVS